MINFFRAKLTGNISIHFFFYSHFTFFFFSFALHCSNFDECQCSVGLLWSTETQRSRIMAHCQRLRCSFIVNEAKFRNIMRRQFTANCNKMFDKLIILFRLCCDFARARVWVMWAVGMRQTWNLMNIFFSSTSHIRLTNCRRWTINYATVFI